VISSATLDRRGAGIGLGYVLGYDNLR